MGAKSIDELANEPPPHHCDPEDVAALVVNLEALADPQQEASPTFENTDFRSLAGVCARVIKYLAKINAENRYMN